MYLMNRFLVAIAVLFVQLNHSSNRKNENLFLAPSRCTICLNDFAPRDNIFRTRCNHQYHEDCFKQFKEKSEGAVKEKCPDCRKVLDEKLAPDASTSSSLKLLKNVTTELPKMH
jgi:hypothetical protein